MRPRLRCGASFPFRASSNSENRLSTTRCSSLGLRQVIKTGLHLTYVPCSGPCLQGRPRSRPPPSAISCRCTAPSPTAPAGASMTSSPPAAIGQYRPEPPDLPRRRRRRHPQGPDRGWTRHPRRPHLRRVSDHQDGHRSAGGRPGLCLRPGAGRGRVRRGAVRRNPGPARLRHRTAIGRLRFRERALFRSGFARDFNEADAAFLRESQPRSPWQPSTTGSPWPLGGLSPAGRGGDRGRRHRSSAPAQDGAPHRRRNRGGRRQPHGLPQPAQAGGGRHRPRRPRC